MNHRLQQFLAAENLTQSQFADSIEATRGSVSHVLSGRNKPGFDFIESMARRYPALNLEWLVTGKGKMYKQAVNQEDIPFEEPGDMPEEIADKLSPSSSYTHQAAIKPSTSNNNAQSIINKQVEQPNTPLAANIDHITVFYSDGTYKEIR